MDEMLSTLEERTASPGLDTLAELYGEELADLEQTLWDIFSKTAARFPHHDAVVSLWQREQAEYDLDVAVKRDAAADGPSKDPVIRWNYATLLRRSEALAAWLHNRGCRRGMPLAVYVWNSAEWGLFFWAAARLGMAYVPLDPRSLANDSVFLLEATSPVALVVQDADAASTLNRIALNSGDGIKIRLQCSGTLVEGWQLLQQAGDTTDSLDLNPNNLVEADRLQEQPLTDGQNDRSQSSADDVALIVFTSGTTGSPKGCVHTNRNLVSETCDYDPNEDPSLFDRWLVHTPSSHIFAVNNALRAWRYGGTVVFPSKAFDVEATLQALIGEQCTIMSAVPTLVKALIQNPAFPGKESMSLSVISIGGTLIRPEDIRLCKDGLGTKHAIQAYGMSEGAPVISWSRRDSLLVDGYHSGVGRILPGARMRVCDPESGLVLRRNEIGELHIGGPSVIQNYLHGAESHRFYVDDIGNWLKTGDQAKIDDDGAVQILGRYNDLIIRAGENISPAKIENAIGEIPGVTAQVIGIPDDIAGHVPIAVVNTSPECSKTEIADKARSLGPLFTLDGVYTLDDLGLQTFPITSLGKVKKQALKQAVLDYRIASCQHNSTATTEVPELEIHNGNLIDETVKQTAPGTIIHQLTSIWEDLVGVRPEPEDSVSIFADSITVLRFCDRVLNATGCRLYLQDIAQNDTVAKQAVLLSQREAQHELLDLTTTQASMPAINGHFANNDANGHDSHGDGQLFHRKLPSSLPWGKITNAGTRAVASPARTTLRKSPHYATMISIRSAGLEMSDVEDIIPIKDSFHKFVVGQRPQSYHTRAIFQVLGADAGQVRAAVEAAFASRPLFRTLLGQQNDGTLFHIVVKPTAGAWHGIIHEIEVDDEAQLQEVVMDGSNSSHSSVFLNQATIITSKSARAVTLCLTYNHSTIDAVSLLAWNHDLDRLISDHRAKVPPLTPFKMYSDLSHLYRSSVPAQESIDFNVSRLRGISRFIDALWPPQRAPGWMIANDDGSPYATQRAAVRNEVWKGGWEAHANSHQFPRSSRVVALPDLAHLKTSRRIEPSLLAKTALAVFNVLQTGASYAVFNTWEAARSWPFVPIWMEAILPPPMAINGPTVEWTVNMTHVTGQETVGQLLERSAREHSLLEEHAHAPWFKVLEGLGSEADVVNEASYRQSFVWHVTLGFSRGLGSEYKALRPVARYDWPDCGLFWNAFMIDKVNMVFVASWDTAQMNNQEVQGYCDALAEVLRLLARADSWDKKVCDVFSREGEWR